MAVEISNAEDIVDNVTVWLANEFSADLSRTAVGVIVRAAYRDLEGQIVPDAHAEMLHRLARARIARLVQVL